MLSARELCFKEHDGHLIHRVKLMITGCRPLGAVLDWSLQKGA
jgi:hypothetical protein